MRVQCALPNALNVNAGQVVTAAIGYARFEKCPERMFRRVVTIDASRNLFKNFKNYNDVY